MTTKSTESQAPSEGAFLMYIDDFLNTIEAEIHKATGALHRESIQAYGKAKYAAHELKKTETEWRADFKKFLNSIPS